MKNSNTKRKNILKLTAATFAIIGVGTILFHSAAEVVLAANNGKVEKVPTTYQVSGSSETTLPKVTENGKDKESGNVKVNYTLSMDSIPPRFLGWRCSVSERADTGKYEMDLYDRCRDRRAFQY